MGAGCYGEIVLQDRRIAYAVTDRELRVMQVGGRLDIFPGGAASWLGAALPDLVPELVGSEEALQQVLDGSRPRVRIPWVNYDGPGGETLYFNLVALPHADTGGRVSGIVYVIQDVTEIGVLEQRLMQHRNDLRMLERTLREQNVRLSAANTELLRLDEVKSAFVSIAAHELRTPLSSISGYVEMLLDGDAGELTQRQHEYLSIIESSAERLLGITRDLLDLARIESGRLELSLQPTDLLALLETLVMEQAPQLEGRSQRVVVHAAPGVPLALVDRQRTAQVIGNLISNASKYAAPGTTIDIAVGGCGRDRLPAGCGGGPGVGRHPRGGGPPVRPFMRGASAAHRRARRGPGALHCEAAGRTARRADLAGEQAGRGIDLLHHLPCRRGDGGVGRLRKLRPIPHSAS